MTKEEKELLLKDLCARLPYGVIMQVTMYDIQDKYDKDKITTNVKLSDGNIGYIMRESHWISYKPYLRPMSSQTIEEKEELNNILQYQYYSDDSCMCEATDWLNAHRFDYRGLIEKGLAISTEVFNPYKE